MTRRPRVGNGLVRFGLVRSFYGLGCILRHRIAGRPIGIGVWFGKDCCGRKEADCERYLVVLHTPPATLSHMAKVATGLQVGHTVGGSW